MKLDIGNKLRLGFGTVVALMLASGGLSYWKLRENANLQEYVLAVRVPSIVRLRSLQRDLNATGIAARRVVLAANQVERRATAMKMCDGTWASVATDLDDIDKLTQAWNLPDSVAKLAIVREQISKLKQGSYEAMELSNNKTPNAIVEAGNMLMDQGSAINSILQKNLNEIVDTQEASLKKEDADLAAAKASLYWFMGISTMLAVGFGIAIAAYIGRQIAGGAASVLRQAEAIAEGDLTLAELESSSDDELGDLNRAVNKMHSHLREMVESIASNARQVATASEQFSQVSEKISASSEETTAQASVVSSATELVNKNLQTVATGAEQMKSTIQDISKNATEAARVAGEAVKTAEATNATISDLGSSSAEIGQVIKVITSIAQQTNLLALNATIEAARAGEAGKGFAVVANEVKELAKQTAKATEDISSRIQGIQNATTEAVKAIQAIGGVIHKIDDISNTIATAVEEQSATTDEMSRNVVEAAKGAGEIANNIRGVAEAARGTSSSAHDSLAAAQALSKMSSDLRGLVDRFNVNGSQADGNRSEPGYLN